MITLTLAEPSNDVWLHCHCHKLRRVCNGQDYFSSYSFHDVREVFARYLTSVNHFHGGVASTVLACDD